MGSDHAVISGQRPSAVRVAGEAFLSGYADRLVKKHGRNADLFAIKRADVLLRQGDEARGAWWLKLFRHIALSHIARSGT